MTLYVAYILTFIEYSHTHSESQPVAVDPYNVFAG